jgi:hypothetical protein
MWPSRLLAALLVCVTLPAAAQYVLPNEPKTGEEKAFYSAVARAIFALVPAERGKFGLTLDERQPPTFYGRELNTIEPLPCERIAAFGMLGFATELGHISAAVCADGARARELSRRAKAHLVAMARQFGASEADLRKAGWTFAQEALPGGADYYYFPVLLISHGVVGPLTGVLHERRSGKALVVQMEVRRMCEFGEFKGAPFCADAAGVLKRMVLGLRGVL